MDILQCVKDISGILRIPTPKISYNTSNFKTSTMLAQIDVKNKIIYIKQGKSDLDLVFAIAHELRHMWQYKYFKSKYLKNYKNANEELTLEEYNLQPAEVDANAFACAIINCFFGVEPLWNGMTDKVVNAIRNKAKKIKI